LTFYGIFVAYWRGNLSEIPLTEPRHLPPPYSTSLRPNVHLSHRRIVTFLTIAPYNVVDSGVVKAWTQYV